MIHLDWQAYLQDYNKQIRLEQYQQTRQLSKPKTSKLTVALYVWVLFVISTGLTVLFFVVAPLQLWGNILAFAVSIICTVESYGRLLGIKLVECYQHYATEATRRKCKCIPSCSEYAIICLRRYELVYSLIKIRNRLLNTCKGFDYIIDEP